MSEYNQLGIALRRHSRISTISKSCDKQVLYLSFMCDISLCEVVLYDDLSLTLSSVSKGERTTVWRISWEN